MIPPLNAAAFEVEKQRDQAVQTQPCPSCGAQPGQRCRWESAGSFPWTSHTGRYTAAVAAGLVPALAGAR